MNYILQTKNSAYGRPLDLSKYENDSNNATEIYHGRVVLAQMVGASKRILAPRLEEFLCFLYLNPLSSLCGSNMLFAPSCIKLHHV